MTNKKMVEIAQEQLIQKIFDYLKEKELNMVEFKTPFRIYVEEKNFNEDYLRVPILAKYLYDDGTIGTEDGDEKLNFLDIYELAHIADILENEDYLVEEQV